MEKVWEKNLRKQEKKMHYLLEDILLLEYVWI